EDGGERLIRLVRLVDRQRVVRDQVAERVGDPDEQRVEALLGQHLVEDVGEPAVRRDELVLTRDSCVSGHDPEVCGGPHDHPLEGLRRLEGVTSPRRGNRCDMTLEELRAEAAGCTACPLWQTGTQTVFGEGAAGAEVMFVGEQPGDQEDKQGRPFVGPAGRLLDEALELAGIDRTATYVTNAVKHFKWEARGKRRIHAKPSWSEQMACRPWLESEL